MFGTETLCWNLDKVINDQFKEPLESIFEKNRHNGQ